MSNEERIGMLLKGKKLFVMKTMELNGIYMSRNDPERNALGEMSMNTIRKE